MSNNGDLQNLLSICGLSYFDGAWRLLDIIFWPIECASNWAFSDGVVAVNLGCQAKVDGLLQLDEL